MPEQQVQEQIIEFEFEADTTTNVTKPSKRIEAFAFAWRLDLGQHPALVDRWPLFSRPPFNNLRNKNISTMWQIAPWGTSSGHNLFVDNTLASVSSDEVVIPISPLFVRDLTGRTIYIGYGPEYKLEDEWLGTQAVTFPRFCYEVTGKVKGHDLIENVFLTKFRMVDMSLYSSDGPTGDPDDTAINSYENANLYPYKIRLDTFYQDGWRLPQTNMVYALSEGLSIQKVETLAAEFLARWQKRPQGQSYEEFHEACGGDNWANELYQGGVTIIPTFEACNGYNKVDANFKLKDYWPGRAVKGLHKVVGTQPNDSPKGTILEVKLPGFVLGRRVSQAEVIVSDGSGYKSPHALNPKPMTPDLKLPHQRTSSVWNKTWLPTHPQHFEEPPIWGWDDLLGKFMQLSGPIWDPLHYYYTSVDKVVRAFKNPMVENNRLVKVPSEMKLQFHPIAAINGFDSTDEQIAKQRMATNGLIKGSIKRVPSTEPSSDVGYHPLPLQYEHELDNWWFPELDPRKRVTPPPQGINLNLAPVIKSAVDPGIYLSTVKAPPSASWLKDPALHKFSTVRALEDYPQLKRYVSKDITAEEIHKLAPIYLAHIRNEILNMTVKDIWGTTDSPEDMETIASGLYDAVYELRERGLELRRIRHNFFREDIATYTIAWWQGISISNLIKLSKEVNSEE